MGKVRTVLIKRLARELVDRYSVSFTTDFDKNKEVVDELLTNTTKRLRNRIAGYITHLVRLRQPQEVLE
ncbi:MAG: 30S ribosomal protein S17e [Promethearchaeota archaeon]